MSDIMSVKDAAELWNLTENRIAKLCRDGKIKGARKEGRFWSIPVDAQNPLEHLRKDAKLPLPIGVSDYRLASAEYYYIDKTMMIKDFLDERPKVSLFTRPRRFGKTLNMDMFRTFFEKTEEDTSVFFKDKKIWACGQKYRNYQGKYPVVFLTFKDVKFETWKETLDHINCILAQEYLRHTELQGSDKCSQFDKEYYEQVVSGSASEAALMQGLFVLSQMLHQHYGIAPVIIIDEYDTPIQQGYMRGFYEKVVLFMRNFFSGGLKDNKHLSYGFLTGILRVAEESIFSGLNNLKINSVLDKRYSEYFGFTPKEVRQMAAYYGADDKYDELCEWYDGYRFGRTEIFNPWSVINYFGSECEPRAFWQSTGSNDIIGEVIAEADEELCRRLASLLGGKTALVYIDTNVIYPQIRSSPSSVYSFLVAAGYLKVVREEISFNGDFMCETALPNKEIALVYRKEILQKLDHGISQSIAVSIQEAIYSGNAGQLKELIRNLLLQSASCYDTAGESFYHGLMLGICAVMGDAYVTSDREAGEGRYDLQLMPKNNKLPGILIELKAEKNASEEILKKLSQTALQQINEKRYDADMVSRGVKNIYKYGAAFSGKKVEIAMEQR